MKENLIMLADYLTNKGKIVTFKPNSVFGPLTLPGANELDYNKISFAVANILANELTLIRGKLIPVMNDYIKVIKDKLASYEAPSEISKYNIIEQRIPTIVKEWIDTNVIPPKRNMQQLPVVNLMLPLPEDTLIRSKFKQVINSVNVYAEEVLSGYTDAQLIEFWNKYLLNISSSNSAIEYLSFNPLLKINDIILLVLVMGNYRLERPAGVSMDDSAYKETMTIFYSEFLNYLRVAFESYNTDVKLDKLIIGVNAPYEIIVNDDVYTKFLSDNNTPDVLLGALVSGPIANSDFYYNAVKVNATKYATEWTKKVNSNAVFEASKVGGRYKATYSIALGILYTDYLPGDIQPLLCCDLVGAQKALEELLIGKETSAVLDVEQIAKEVIGMILFASTNFTKLTDYMVEYKKLDPTLTPAAAGSFAVLDLVLDYLLQQVDTRN